MQVCQPSAKVKKASLHSESLQSGESEDDEESDEESVASSQTWAHSRRGYSSLSVKKFLQNTEGARNVQGEEVFPDLQLLSF